MLQPLMFLLFDILAFNVSLHCSQTANITGIVLEKTSGTPIKNSDVKYGIHSVKTDYNGYFAFRTIHNEADTIKVTSPGYQIYTKILESKDHDTLLTIFLEPEGILLNEVQINSFHKRDSNLIRKEYQSVFNYKAPQLIDAFSLNSIDIDVLYRSLSKKKKQTNRLKKQLREDEKYHYTATKFNRNLILSIISLSDKELDDFIFEYMPSYDFILNATEYEIIKYVKDSYKEYAEDSKKNNNE